MEKFNSTNLKKLICGLFFIRTRSGYRIHKLEHRKIKSNCICSLNRQGRHGRVDPKVDKTEYDPHDDKFFRVPLDEDEVKKLRGTKTQRLDFPFIRIL